MLEKENRRNKKSLHISFMRKVVQTIFALFFSVINAHLNGTQIVVSKIYIFSHALVLFLKGHDAYIQNLHGFWKACHLYT